MRALKEITASSVLLFSLASCGGGETSGLPGGGATGGAGGGYGATPGGAQDIGFARQIIEEGGVPQEGAFLVEGLLSEHDLAPPGPPCDSLLCVRPALAAAPDLSTGEQSFWVQLGMSSGLSPDSFEHPPIDAVAVIDKSSSMSIDMEETNQAVKNLVDQMREQDRLAILAFDSQIHVIKPLGPVGDKASLKAQVDQITAGGSWDIQAATERGYDILEEAGADPERLRRIMLFSCGYPSVYADGSDAFSQVVQEGARAGIGMSFFGVLLGYHESLASLLGQAHGGAYYYLEDLSRVEQVFSEEFETMVTPLAYDFELTLDLGGGFALDRTYGVPGDDSGISLDVATAFLSNRRGAIVARLSGEPDGDDIGSVRLAYRPESSLGFTAAQEQTEELRAPEGWSPGEEYFQSPGAQKAVALVNQAERMREACATYHGGDAESAIDVLVELEDYLAGEAAALNDPALEAEVELVAKLRDNMGGN